MMCNYRFKNPSQISVELTNKCNFACKHCINESSIKENSELSKEKVYELIDYMDREGVVCLDFSGGEPLLYPYFEEILEYAYQKKLTLSLATNGSLLNDKIIEKLIKAEVSVRISLDGFNEDVNCVLRGRTFETTDKAIKQCVKQGLIPKISVVLHKKNLESFEKLLVYAKENSIEKVRIIPLVTKGRASFLSDLILAKNQWKEFIINHKNLSNKYGIEVAIDSPLQAIIEEDYMPCVVGKFLAVVKSNGDVIPCSVLDVKIGNVYENDLKYIWSNKILDELNDVNKLKGKCKNCDIKNKCAGGCRGLAYVLKGDYLCPDPYCWKENQNK